ncbi:hypothetical protein SNE40_017471 [Patella caerulea]|uniref:TIR domain-containing protein n=1 Tax=Patella caerulea TaxID=87958 RepID=A0AAN8JH56_PATCE
MAVVIPKAKSRGKDYHYCVLYNYFEGPRSRRDDDQKLSRAFLEKMEHELAEIGFTDSYHFEKIRPGNNLFEVFTAGLIEPSEKVVAILTKGFRENYWHKYTQQISFMKLLNCKTAEFLVIVIGEAKEDIPENFGLVKEQFIYFEKEWQDDEHNWNLLKTCFLENKSVQEVCQKSASKITVQETQDSNILAEDGAPDINNLSVSNGNEDLATPLGLHGVAPPGSGGVTSGVPDGLPTTQVISNPTGPRGDPVGAAATGFPDLQLPSPGDIVEDRAPSTPQTNPRTPPDDTETAEPPTDVLPGDTPSIHIRKHVRQGQGYASVSDIDNPAEQKKWTNVIPTVEQSIRKRVGQEKGLESPGDMNTTSNQSSEQKSSFCRSVWDFIVGNWSGN